MSKDSRFHPRSYAATRRMNSSHKKCVWDNTTPSHVAMYCFIRENLIYIHTSNKMLMIVVAHLIRISLCFIINRLTGRQSTPTKPNNYASKWFTRNVFSEQRHTVNSPWKLSYMSLLRVNLIYIHIYTPNQMLNILASPASWAENEHSRYDYLP